MTTTGPVGLPLFLTVVGRRRIRWFGDVTPDRGRSANGHDPSAIRRFNALLTVPVILLSTVVAIWSAPTASANEGACPAQVAAVEGSIAKIADHNHRAPPGHVGPPEVVGPYNREAEQLDGERDANLGRLKQCAVATDRLQAGGPPTKALNDRAREEFRQAIALVPPGWRSPIPLPTIGTRITVPSTSPLKPLWNTINRQKSPQAPYPDVPLQGMPRPSGDDRHPAQPWKTIGFKKKGKGAEPAVSPDHIYPKVGIVYLDRFLELTPENMWLVLNAPLDLQWLPTDVNRTNKNSRSAADIEGVDPEWQARQVELQEVKRRELTDLIAQLADSQEP